MVRTKDLLLIVAVIAMLFMAISATVATRIFDRQNEQAGLQSAAEHTAPLYKVSAPGSATTRQENIERLKRLLAQGDVIESSPSVESSPGPENELANGASISCGTPDTGIGIARSWPLAGAEVNVIGSNRVISQIIPGEITPSASGTPQNATVNQKILIQLPIMPVKQNEPTCLDSEVIGVTPEGSLMFNGDAVLYKTSSAETLVGYARDGFPIYGMYSGEVDVCGGYDSSQGYRYSVSSVNSKFINCYTGIPRTFSE